MSLDDRVVNNALLLTVPMIIGSCTLTLWTAVEVILSWTAAPGATKYTYNYTSSAGTVNRSVTTTGTSVGISGLLPRTSYVFIVTVYGGGNTTGNTVSCSGTTLGRLS